MERNMDPETRTFPTMLGGGDTGAPALDDPRLPTESHGAWRIELRYLPIEMKPLVARGHAFLTLSIQKGRPWGNCTACRSLKIPARY
jgi:hypothetical protein